MIESMSKLHLVIHKPERERVLVKLQDLGLVHIMGHQDGHQDNIDSIPIAGLDSGTDSENILSTIEKKQQIYDSLLAQKDNLLKIHTQLLPWGNFDWKTVNKLKEAGMNIHFFSVAKKQYEKEVELANNVINDSIFIISQTKSTVYFVIISKSKESKEIKEIKEEPLQLLAELNSINLTELKKEVSKLEIKIEISKQELKKLNENKIAINDYLLKVKNKKSLSDARKKLQEHYGSIYALSGWFPKHKKKAIEDLLKNTNGVAHVIEDDIPESELAQTPVLLKNHPLFAPFEKITKLFDLPSYTEFDLTPLFAPFFVLFFGFCFGDAGYGVVLLSAIIFATIIILPKNPSIKPFLIIGSMFSLSAIFWGVITGTIFGIDVLSQKWPIISNLIVFNSSHMFNLALIIGLVQILFGLLIQVLKRSLTSGSVLAGLSPLGWIILVISVMTLYLQDKSAQDDFFIGQTLISFCKWVPANYSLAGLIFGCMLILFFNDMNTKNIFVRIGKGLWELYGITGIFGDLLSYIRLFALGVSSAILGVVINSMAMQILNTKIPILSPLLFVLFLVLGHTGNMLLSMLGSFVHPLRLTFVEFYKNAGFAGGGKAYQPLKKFVNIHD
ncbi:MAG: hypothetical protein HQK49_05265 [Oligoflexia bacterium]|nr:hypothetical protein [Oligoflexia bacterium]